MNVAICGDEMVAADPSLERLHESIGSLLEHIPPDELHPPVLELLERVNAVFGYRAVARIKLVQTPPARAPKFVGLRPLTVGEESQLTTLTEMVPAGELRDALERLGRAVQGGRK